jgi:hypothetical protein
MRTVTTRTIAGRVNGDGSIAQTAGGFTVQKTGSGTYVIKFPGSRLIGASASAMQPQDLLTALSAFTGDSFNVTTFNATNAAAGDVAFVFTATVTA